MSHAALPAECFDLDEMIDGIEAWARVESPSVDPAAVDRMMDAAGEKVAQPAGDEGAGPFLEGGDIIMAGADTVLCGYTDLTSNLAGVRWLARYLEPFG